MSADKYPSIFSRQMKAIVYLSPLPSFRKISSCTPTEHSMDTEVLIFASQIYLLVRSSKVAILLHIWSSCWNSIRKTKATCIQHWVLWEGERDEEAEKRIGSTFLWEEKRGEGSKWKSVVTSDSLGTNVYAADCVLSAFRIRFSEVKVVPSCRGNYRFCDRYLSPRGG